MAMLAVTRVLVLFLISLGTVREAEALRWLLLSLAILAPTVPALADAPNDAEIRGVVGVCVRWGADPDHVEEAAVVVPSSDPALDAAMPESIRRMEWRRPTGKYDGEWIGIWMAVGDEAIRDRPFPDCSHLPRDGGAPQVLAPTT
jgi:hypothetical protein